MSLVEIVKDILAGQDTCPSCGYNWVYAQEVLETEPLTSRELDETLTIIMNCPGGI